MLLCPTVKARTSEAKAKAFEAKAEAKDLTFEAKAKAEDLTSEAASRPRTSKPGIEAASRPRPWPRGLYLCHT
jgi:hypothetical protein